ncbi:uncharacterized protein CTHT_0071150 [Thermochaetoides thermophila DSM 1495]|uniref:DUF2293 domain-containing protein n=1 Tax=Chaetomium thermophilum (strain DSM 1495 / CBS 144.50 / IMI 039719) TaxID=759272 RepID=G0SFK4_CHATD|nr:hypothetical protein CTHT_0071150 [Thermochaetoides thermophila DSM 1495]EGS17769.1 hypothetical protein CTHT_0071150 [Thermochaetoides thermophila DSM 1495]
MSTKEPSKKPAAPKSIPRTTSKATQKRPPKQPSPKPQPQQLDIPERSPSIPSSITSSPCLSITSSSIDSEAELIVHPSDPLPKGYSFVAKGDPYITKQCRERTHALGKALYVVVDPTISKTNTKGGKKRSNGKPCRSGREVLGIRCPKHVYTWAQSQALQTAHQRKEASKRREKENEGKWERVMRGVFPGMPKGETLKEIVAEVTRGAKGKGKGMNGKRMVEWVRLVVRGYVRKNYTEFVELVEGGMDVNAAKLVVEGRVRGILRVWEGRADEKVDKGSDEDEERGRSRERRGSWRVRPGDRGQKDVKESEEKGDKEEKESKEGRTESERKKDGKGCVVQ